MHLLSIEFWGVFAFFFWIYWLFARRPDVQNGLLLLASYGFLASFDPRFALFMAFYTLVIHWLSVLIHRHPGRTLFFAVSVVFSLSCLGTLKYHDFFRDALQAAFTDAGFDFVLPGVELILPLGISFYTLHSITYLVSVWKREIAPGALAETALFLSFFPSVVSGPINRARDFLPQIRSAHRQEVIDPCRALALLILALIKVLWLGGVLSETWIKPVFDNPSEFHSLDILLAVYAYAIHLYLNFSGYTDLVTAIALLLGFTLPPNFDAPYLAANLRDFWRRWHMSLSFFMRDYVYIPLGGSRGGFVSTQFKLLATMLVSGLWHGANWNFLVWGAIHGIGLILVGVGGRIFGKPLIANRALATLLTFHYVCFAWIFFRCPTLADSLDLLKALGGNFDAVPLRFNVFSCLGVFVLAFAAYPWTRRLPGYAAERMLRVHWSLRPLILGPLAWATIALSPAGIPEFIYSAF
ncbi:MAG: MBOAT family protein [Candidatus Accumulibacter sp.]|jgi:D-alanyl-lipoteichoic acid acyltransferase DltB (MBOAT superfamily)|nr:MBOAT family protein [Accumulibacter sp.]